jgi:FixJ family two-component response regulator
MTASLTAGNTESMVLVLDDDPSVLPALARLVRSAGFKVSTFDRPSALLASQIPKANACMLVDVHLPEMNGIELCKRLAESERGLPVIGLLPDFPPIISRDRDCFCPPRAVVVPVV